MLVKRCYPAESFVQVKNKELQHHMKIAINAAKVFLLTIAMPESENSTAVSRSWMQKSHSIMIKRRLALAAAVDSD